MVMVFLLCLIFPAFAGEVVLSLSLDELRIGQSVELNVELQDLQSNTAPIVPSGSGVSVQLQSNRSTKIYRSINFQSTSIIRYHYLLHAHQEGKWTIGPVKVKVGNKSYTSNAVEVNVLPKQSNVVEDINVNASLSSTDPYEG